MPPNAYYQPSRKLVSQADAALIKRADVPRSRFNNRWSHLTTFDAGLLIPFLVDEILPGDHMRYNVTAYVRMQTALFPMYSNQRLDTFFFYVPLRIVWDNFTKMMGEQDNPADSIAFTIPQIVSPAGGHVINSVYDHMGLPCAGQVTAGQTYTHSALPLRAYTQIWNQWFRDQNAVDSLAFSKGNGPDLSTAYALRYRAKSHDYFTSALPWPQKGTALQSLFTGQVPVTGLGFRTSNDPQLGPVTIRQTLGADVVYDYFQATDDAAAIDALTIKMDQDAVGGRPVIYADLAQATGVTINALRQAWLVQDLLERDARGGTRYVELVFSHFNVHNPDYRVQRPEYIGGGQTPINLTPIAQTTPTGGGGLGALGAAGTAAGQHSASYAATEHGLIIGLINVRTELHYQQGLHKQWSRLVRQDHYFPVLAGLGEQAILRQEIYCNGVDAEDSLVFGYQERWQELRTRHSEVTGMFRSTTAGNIDEWHLGQQFSSAPILNASFLNDAPPMDRVLAAGALTVNMQYLADILIERQATRPLPMYGTPATLQRF